MNEKELKELQDSLQKSIKDGLDDLKKQQGEELEKSKKTVDELQAKLKEVSEKLEKLEKAPAQKKVNVLLHSEAEMYKGYRVSKQGQIFKNRINSRGESPFQTLNSEERIDQFSKFMIDLMKSMVEKDQEARADLRKFYEETQGKATLYGGATGTGPYLVPDEFAFDIVDLGRDRTFALQKCTVIPMGSDQLYVPAELTLASLNWKAENAQMAAGEPTFAQVSLTAKNLTGMATTSNQMLQDSAVDVVSILSEQFGYGTALELDNQVLNGTGNPCSGVMTAKAGYSVVMASGSTNFSAVTFDHISQLIDKIPEGFAYDLSFVFNKLIKRYLREIKDSQNRYILQDPGGMTPGTLWGVPYINSSKGPSTSAVSTACAVVGNWKYFYIGRRQGAMTLEADPYGLFDYNYTRFRMVTRWALSVAQTGAFARLVTAAS